VINESEARARRNNPRCPTAPPPCSQRAAPRQHESTSPGDRLILIHPGPAGRPDEVLLKMRTSTEPPGAIRSGAGHQDPSRLGWHPAAVRQRRSDGECSCANGSSAWQRPPPYWRPAGVCCSCSPVACHRGSCATWRRSSRTASPSLRAYAVTREYPGVPGSPW